MSSLSKTKIMSLIDLLHGNESLNQVKNVSSYLNHGVYSVLMINTLL